MDPNACLARMLDAIVSGDKDEAIDAASDLNEWLARGGFEPDWREACWDLFAKMPDNPCMDCGEEVETECLC